MEKVDEIAANSYWPPAYLTHIPHCYFSHLPFSYWLKSFHNGNLNLQDKILINYYFDQPQDKTRTRLTIIILSISVNDR